MRAYQILILFLAVMLITTSLFAGDYYSKSDRDQLINKELDCVQSYTEEKRPALWNKACHIAGDEARPPRSVHDRLAQNMARIDEDMESLQETATAVREMDRGDTEQPGFLNEKKKGVDLWGRLLHRDNPLNTIEFGLELFGYDYREPHLMRQDGYFSGVFAAYTHRTNVNKKFDWQEAFSQDSKINMFRLDARFSYGEVDYESDGSGADNGIPNYIFETRGVAGYDMPINDSFRLTPYVGLGYRFLLDNSGGRRTTVGHYGYDRESNYYYMPIGLEFHKEHQNSWSTDFVLEYDLFLHGKQVSRLELGYGNLENDQQVGLGLRSSIKFMKSAERVDYFFEPFVRFWHIDDSDVSINCDQICIAGYEPDNSQYEYGLKAGLSY